ncbi:helix-turn-helix-type transcriptional regulator [Photobacterium sanctipauli]|uniref:Helix-turn-helix-type transcriptional regulator n=1 Tax=Photobacterium sanctipauli TaxID=1342794 RepID=A0A2T3NVC8_9GAMM|nr:MerR family transcriptional regulator [Photobacterium sanctipauli]PSW20178.1 helix-turn-helix-type transcriptional regulator [Photobacterium sanctipauli]
MDCNKELYAIKDVSEITGVNSVTLRAWQRRYGLLNPKRTDKGHRLYSQDDINKIHEILSWLEKGVAIGKVRPLIDSNLASEPTENEIESNSDSIKAVEALMISIAELDGTGVDKQLTTLLKEYPLDVFEGQIASVVDHRIHVEANPLASIQASLWCSVLSERCLFQVAKSRKRNNKPCVLISFDTVPSYRVWLTTMALSESGYNVTLLTSLSGKLVALSAMMRKSSTKILYVDGENKLTRDDYEQLATLINEVSCEVRLSGSLKQIHPELECT